MPKSKSVISAIHIEDKIYLVRGHKVMLDSDLAEIYGVTTARLNEQVKRNIDRFPHDFMFQLNKTEWQNLISQNATSKWGGRRKLPYVFSEHGAVMLASVLNSKIAVEASIQVVRAFVRLREFLLTNKVLAAKLELLENKFGRHDKEIRILFEAIRQLMETEKPPPRKQIGYKKNTGND
jgi:hypothetical protein